jgi:hypothetical protein
MYFQKTEELRWKRNSETSDAMDFHPTSWADLDPDKFDGTYELVSQKPELGLTSRKEIQESARRGDSFTRFKAEKRRGALVISVSSATSGGPHLSAEAR